jgi:hypothetical protein
VSNSHLLLHLKHTWHSHITLFPSYSIY